MNRGWRGVERAEGRTRKLSIPDRHASFARGPSLRTGDLFASVLRDICVTRISRRYVADERVAAGVSAVKRTVDVHF